MTRPTGVRPDLTDEDRHPLTKATMASIYCPESYQPQDWPAVIRRFRELLQVQRAAALEAVAFIERAERIATKLETTKPADSFRS